MADCRRKNSRRSVGYYSDLNNLTTAGISENIKRRTPCLKGVYTVEDIIGSRCSKSFKQREFLVKWRGWGSEFNSWEPEDHIIDKQLIRNFDKPKIDECEIDAHVEMIQNVIESGLTQTLQTDSTIFFNHRVFRYLFKRKGNGKGNEALHSSDFPRKYFPEGWDIAYCNKRLVQRKLRYPIHMRPFLARSKQIYNADGTKKRRRWMQKLTISFRKQTI